MCFGGDDPEKPVWEKPGAIDYHSASPEQAAAVDRMKLGRGIYDQYLSDDNYNRLLGRHQAEAQTRIGNQFGNIGLAGSSMDFGARENAAQDVQDRELLNRLNVQGQSAGLEQQIFGDVGSIQDRQYQHELYQMGQYQNAVQQNRQANAAGWTAIGSVAGGAAGFLAGGPMGAMMGSQMGGQITGGFAGGGMQQQQGGGMNPYQMASLYYGNQGVPGATPFQSPGSGGSEAFMNQNMDNYQLGDWGSNPYKQGASPYGYGPLGG